MISEKMSDLLSKQMNLELCSSYMYLAIASNFNNLGLSGMAHWMRIQAAEEICHAMKIYNHIEDRGGKVVLMDIGKPPSETVVPLEVFRRSLSHEEVISSQINDLITAAYEENDQASLSFLKWFVDEQIQEEAAIRKIIQRLELIEDQKQGMLIVDQELNKRMISILKYI